MRVNGDELQFGDLCTIGFERTLRIPRDGCTYSLPPGLGTFQVHDLSASPYLPAAWEHRDALVIGLAPCEALWLCFSARWWHPCAVKLAVDGVNVLTGQPWQDGLHQPQDYLACPEQPWLAAYSPHPGEIMQFVAPAGSAESNDSGSRELRIAFYPPQPGRFRNTPPEAVSDPFVIGRPCELMVGRGQEMRHRTCPDPHGREIWDQSAPSEVQIRLVSLSTLRALTGIEPDPSPIGREDYEMFGIPWLDEYEDNGRAGT